MRNVEHAAAGLGVEPLERVLRLGQRAPRARPARRPRAARPDSMNSAIAEPPRVADRGELRRAPRPARRPSRRPRRRSPPGRRRAGASPRAPTGPGARPPAPRARPPRSRVAGEQRDHRLGDRHAAAARVSSMPPARAASTSIIRCLQRLGVAAPPTSRSSSRMPGGDQATRRGRPRPARPSAKSSHAVDLRSGCPESSQNHSSVDGEVQRAAGVAAVAQPAQRGEDVLALGLQQREPLLLAGAAQARLGGARPARRSSARGRRGWPPARPPRPASPARTRGSSRASGSARASAGDDLQQRAVDQRGEPVEVAAHGAPRSRPWRRRRTRPAGAASRRSSSVSSSQLQSTTARSVRWRGSAVRLPPVSRRKRSSRRSASSSSGSERSRAAASSSASGRPSSRRQISTTARRASSTAKLGVRRRRRGRRTAGPRGARAPLALARAGSRAADGGDALAGDGQRLAAGGHDPQPRAGGEQPLGQLGDGRRSGARSCRARASPRGRRARRAAARACRGRPAGARCSVGVAHAQRAEHGRARSRPRAVTGASSTIQTPSATRSTQRATASRASRVLPAPPGPTSVTSRLRSSSSPMLLDLRARGRRSSSPRAGRFVRETGPAPARSPSRRAGPPGARPAARATGGTPSSSHQPRRGRARRRRARRPGGRRRRARRCSWAARRSCSGCSRAQRLQLAHQRGRRGPARARPRRGRPCAASRRSSSRAAAATAKR